MDENGGCPNRRPSGSGLKKAFGTVVRLSAATILGEVVLLTFFKIFVLGCSSAAALQTGSRTDAISGDLIAGTILLFGAVCAHVVHRVLRGTGEEAVRSLPGFFRRTGP